MLFTGVGPCYGHPVEISLCCFGSQSISATGKFPECATKVVASVQVEKEVSVEATQKTTATRAALLVVAALSMLLSGLFVATASNSDASPPPACPEGFVLTADGKNCYQNAVVTTADNPNTCPTGEMITPDGSQCYIKARIIPQEGSTSCPSGYSPDNSLGGMCARFTAATQGDATCPSGAAGVADSCYILVAKGPAGTATCANGTLQGNQCVIAGPAPTPGAGSCPTSTTVFFAGGQCYRVLSPTTATSCDTAAGYLSYQGVCKAVNPIAADDAAHDSWTCPATSATATPIAVRDGVLNAVKIDYCYYTPSAEITGCPSGADLGLVGGQCRQAVGLTSGGLVCQTGYGLVGTNCLAYENPTPTLASCPIGAVEDTDGNCRKPVANQAGAYTCPADAALNGTSCVYTTGFTVDPAETLYKCDRGTRSVIGSGSGTGGNDGSLVQVICFTGPSEKNITEGPSCLQGVLSTDNLYCIVPRIDTAPAAAVSAPVPSFTG